MGSGIALAGLASPGIRQGRENRERSSLIAYAFQKSWGINQAAAARCGGRLMRSGLG